MDNHAVLPLTPEGGLCGADREVFQRVWQRVMPQETPGCPITLKTPETLPPPIVPTQTAPEFSQPQPIFTPIPPPPAALSPATVAAAPEKVPSQSGLLQEFILEEFQDSVTYHALAHRVAGGPKSTLWAISREESLHQKRLTVAYFLLTGVHLLPQPSPHQRPKDCIQTELRRRYWAETAGAAAYRAAAEACTDCALKALYLDLAEDETAHAALLRSLLEKG
ncbi:MAG: hypothetical protein RR450_00965 [Oscillospiraceae bacterium]